MNPLLDSESNQAALTPDATWTPVIPSRRRFLRALAVGTILGVSACLESTGPSGGVSPSENRPDDVVLPVVNRPLAIARTSGTPASSYGIYRGDALVELLVEGERRSIQRTVEVRINEPLEYDGVVETNPVHLSIRTPFDGEITEGYFNLLSAGLAHTPPNAPGLDYEPTEQWLVQSWELTINDGQLSGTLTGEEGGGTVWFDQDFGATGVFVQPAYFLVGTTITGTLDNGQFTATVSGYSSQVDAFRITVNAQRPGL